DFSSIRVHTDERAAESAHSLNAQAYTVGQHIVFGANRFAEDTPSGRRLLAHELTHTLQQGSGAARAYSVDSPLTDTGEREAESVAARVMAMTEHGDHAVAVHGLAPMVQREVADADEEVFEEQTGEESAELLEDEAYDGDTPVYASATPPEDAEPESEGKEEAVAEEAAGGTPAQKGKGGMKPKAPAKPSGPAPGSKITRVDVDLASQTLALQWSDGTKEGSHRISSGRGRPNTKDDPCKTQTEENCTPVGD